jgi:hypothetical protein
MRDSRTHLHARAFPAQRQPRADGRQSPEEFHEQQARGYRRQFVVQDRFDLRNAAPRGVGRETPDQPSRKRHRHGAGGRYDQKPAELPTLSPEDRRIPESVGLGQRQAEDRADQPGCRSRDQRQKR